MNSDLSDGNLSVAPAEVPSVSVVICSRGRHNSLLRTLQSLESDAHDEKLLELLIVEETDNPSPPPGEKIRYFHIPEKGLGLAFARNYALQKVRGSLMVFIDDDIVPSPHWLNALISPFNDPDVVATGGPVLPNISDINAIGRCVSFLGFPAGGLKRYFEAKGENKFTRNISGGNCAFRTQVAKEIGGFDEFMRGVEDTDFFHRMAARSGKMLFVPSAFVFHNQRETLTEVYKWFIRRGIGNFSLKCKQKGPISALILPLRMNFTLKLLLLSLSFMMLCRFSTLGLLIALILLPLLWNEFLWRRIHSVLWQQASSNEMDDSLEAIRMSICINEVRLLLFLVKFLMDLGSETGSYIAFLRFVKNRFLSKPFILTLHYLDKEPHSVTRSIQPYYYSAEDFERLLYILERRGYFIVSLSAIIQRLRENSNVLFLDKIVAVTFDDAHEDIYACLLNLGQKKSYPITIFVPTTFVGQFIQWDPAMASAAGRVLGWPHLKKLKDLGMEIGSHARSHPHLTRLPMSVMHEEVFGSMTDLETNLFGDALENIVFSYPYGECNQIIPGVVAAAGYIGAVANFPRNIRPDTDPFQIPRFSVAQGIGAIDILKQSRSLWLRELIRDIMSFMKKRFMNTPSKEYIHVFKCYNRYKK